jgi:hypothetical protein
MDHGTGHPLSRRVISESRLPGDEGSARSMADEVLTLHLVERQVQVTYLGQHSI